MASNPLIDVMLRNHVKVQRLTADEITRIDDFIRQIAEEIARRLSGAAQLTGHARSRLERTLERLQEYIGSTLGDYSKELMADLMALAQHAAESSATALSATVGSDFTVPTLKQIQAAALSTPLAVSGPDGGKLIEPYIKDWTATETARVSNAVRLGVAQGQTNAQIVQAIRGTASAGYRDGILALTKRSADSIVTTAVQHVATAARQSLFDANDGIVAKIEWVSTLDNRTCPRCGALDLKQFPLDSGPRPPLHFRCRCTVVPILKGGFAKMQRGGTRPAVVDGEAEQVSAGTNYFTWLKRQPATFQDFALGPTRAKLLRDGGLSADRFAQLQLDKRFMPMTLEEARQVDPIAFTKAGL
jgi:SPP1 gp7 family putative phage head morphogenesis protein